jgi:hypothetical protein
LILGLALAVPTIGAAVDSRAGPGPPAVARADAGTVEVRAADPDGGAPADAPRANGGRSPAPSDDPLERARAAMRVLAHAVETIQRIGAKAPRDAYTANCVAERLAEARIGVRLGDQESARLEASLAQHDREEAAYALRRLGLLADRAASVLASARICATEDTSGVTATKVEVEISPAVPAGDPTAPPPPPPVDMRPANTGRP